MSDNSKLLIGVFFACLLLSPCAIVGIAVANLPPAPPAYDFQPLIDTPKFAKCWESWSDYYNRNGWGLSEDRACARWNTFDECVFQVDNDAPDYPGRPVGCFE